MAGSFGTNYAYGVGDVLNIVSTNEAGQGVLRILNSGPVSTIGSSQALQVIPVAGTPVIVHSFTTAGSGAGGTATSTSATGLTHFKQLDIFADVTFSQGAATNTLILRVDGRHPDGTAFVSIAAFAAITTAGMHIIHLSKDKAVASTATVEVDAGLGTTRAIGWHDAIRVRREITGTATTQFTATIYIYNQVG